jgi:hypothetical protein
MIGNTRKPDSAEEYGITGAQDVQTIVGHHLSVPEVVLTAPVEIQILQAQPPMDLAQSIQNLAAGGHSFFADAISRDRRNLKCFHPVTFSP